MLAVDVYAAVRRFVFIYDHIDDHERRFLAESNVTVKSARVICSQRVVVAAHQMTPRWARSLRC